MDEQNRPFNEVIAEYANGRLLERLSAELAEVTRAVMDTNLKGNLALTIAIEPSGDGAVTMRAEVKAKVPKRGIGQAIFYADTAGNLSRRDPRQMEMPLRSVAGAGINAA